MAEITSVTAREILDSRANPTIETEITLSDGARGVASVPSGASTGKYEAIEKRDINSERYHKKGVLDAILGINEIISPALLGMDAYDISEADSVMIALDGMCNKSNLGANAILSVSLALARAGADSLSLPLYRYLGGALVRKLPVPMMNILNGGRHADNNIDIQEFMIIPTGADSFSEGVRMCSEVYHSLKNILKSKKLQSSVGDEGGFAPMLESDEEAIKLIINAADECGYRDGSDFMIGIDAAASEWRQGEKYLLPKRGVEYTSDALVDYLVSLSEKYPILSIEDGVGEEDYQGWSKLTERFEGSGVLLIGDDLFVTDPRRIEKGMEMGIANSVLIKPNQIGTLSEVADAVRISKEGGYKTVISHRSGETEDTFIADLSVALGADYIKTGAPARGERTAKYNRLMKIESELFVPIY